MCYWNWIFAIFFLLPPISNFPAVLPLSSSESFFYVYFFKIILVLFVNFLHLVFQYRLFLSYKFFLVMTSRHIFNVSFSFFFFSCLFSSSLFSHSTFYSHSPPSLLFLSIYIFFYTRFFITYSSYSSLPPTPPLLLLQIKPFFFLSFFSSLFTLSSFSPFYSSFIVKRREAAQVDTILMITLDLNTYF